MAVGQPSSRHGNQANLSLADQLMQLDSAITSTLHEIDANFAKAHQIVTSTLLPAVKVYGQHTARTWHSAKLWQEFFIMAANIGSQQPESEQSVAEDDDDNEDYEDEEEEETFQQEGSPESSHQQQDESGTDFFQTVKHVHASSPAKAKSKGNKTANKKEDDEETSWANMESPFERLKKELAGHNPSSADDQSMSQAEMALARHRSQAAEQSKSRLDAYDLDEDDDEDLSLPPPPDVTDRVAKVNSTTQVRSPAKIRGRSQQQQQSGGQTPRLLHKVLSQEQKKANSGATPGPAATKSKLKPQSQSSRPPQWDGVADLRNTPLRSKPTSKGKSKAASQATEGKSRAASQTSVADKGKSKASSQFEDADSSGDSLAWPPGMSPPVTMQFSVPRSRFAKTPAKEAAKLLMDDLLRTAEAGPNTIRRREMQRLQQQEGEGADQSQASPLTSMRLRPGPEPASSRGYSAVGTPLKKGPLGRIRKPGSRRDSMPTPPTITRIGAKKTNQREDNNVDVDDSGLPSFSLRSGSKGVTPTAAGSASGGGRAALLLDEGEGGDDDDDDDDNLTADDLTPGRLGQHQHQRTDLDSLLSSQGGKVSSEDSESSSSSEEESSDESSSEDNLNPSTHRLPLGQETTSSSVGTWTDSSSLSTKDLDNDTLFGISGQSIPSQPRVHTDDRFKLINAQLEDTIRGGKILDEEKDLTYSAPSPTPAPR